MNRRTFLQAVSALGLLGLAGELWASPKREFYGTVEALPPGGGYFGQWVVSGTPVLVRPGTEFDFRDGQPAIGSFVKVEGQWSGGVFVARELKTRGGDRGRGRSRGRGRGRGWDD